MSVRLILSFLGWFAVTVSPGLAAETNSPGCNITKEERAKFLALSFEQFDQSADQGWRALADEPGQPRKCYLMGARLLREYAKRHKELDSWQRMLITFHSGQIYAQAHSYESAIKQLRKSFAPKEEEWNIYVRATIAFLRYDKPSLLQERTKLAATEQKMNLNVVDELIHHFGESYADAYGAD